MCWVKITRVAGKYKDQGGKISQWIGRVAENCIRDYFRIAANRQRLRPTFRADREVLEAFAAPPTRPEEVLPAKPIRPKGASPDGTPGDTGWNGPE
jgi:hypothetical protein